MLRHPAFLSSRTTLLPTLTVISVISRLGFHHHSADWPFVPAPTLVPVLVLLVIVMSSTPVFAPLENWVRRRNGGGVIDHVGSWRCIRHSHPQPFSKPEPVCEGAGKLLVDVTGVSLGQVEMLLYVRRGEKGKAYYRANWARGSRGYGEEEEESNSGERGHWLCVCVKECGGQKSVESCG